MEKESANKVLLVTGATSGIGKATALRFAAGGAAIAGVGRDEAALNELQKQMVASARSFWQFAPIYHAKKRPALPSRRR